MTGAGTEHGVPEIDGTILGEMMGGGWLASRSCWTTFLITPMKSSKDILDNWRGGLTG